VAAFARRFAAWRREKGLILHATARKLGVATSSILEWERGGSFPSVFNMERIAKLMGLPVCCLICVEPGRCPYLGRDCPN
jgi:transcriptional regulator with XRE-family HTH domain